MTINEAKKRVREAGYLIENIEPDEAIIRKEIQSWFDQGYKADKYVNGNKMPNDKPLPLGYLAKKLEIEFTDLVPIVTAMQREKDTEEGRGLMKDRFGISED